MKNSNKYLVEAAMIASLYVVLTIISGAIGLASGPIQVRVSEALTILPVFTKAAIPGLTLGCVISNVITGCPIWDVLLGSLATFLGALGTWYLRKHALLASLPPILSNMLVIPFVLSFVYGAEGSIWFFVLTVGIGEVISCLFLGQLLRKQLEKYPILKNPE